MNNWKKRNRAIVRVAISVLAGMSAMGLCTSSWALYDWAECSTTTYGRTHAIYAHTTQHWVHIFVNYKDGKSGRWELINGSNNAVALRGTGWVSRDYYSSLPGPYFVRVWAATDGSIGFGSIRNYSAGGDYQHAWWKCE